MPHIRVDVVELISDDQPGFVAVQLIDAYGKVHLFHDKAPVFGCDWLDRNSPLPATGCLDCEIVDRFADHGRQLARIDTERPWAIESTSGMHEFVVAVSDVIISD